MAGAWVGGQLGDVLPEISVAIECCSDADTNGAIVSGIPRAIFPRHAVHRLCTLTASDTGDRKSVV